MNYKELIDEYLDKIDNERFLRAIYISVRDYVKERVENEGGTYQEDKRDS